MPNSLLSPSTPAWGPGETQVGAAVAVQGLGDARLVSPGVSPGVSPREALPQAWEDNCLVLGLLSWPLKALSPGLLDISSATGGTASPPHAGANNRRAQPHPGGQAPPDCNEQDWACQAEQQGRPQSCSAPSGRLDPGCRLLCPAPRPHGPALWEGLTSGSAKPLLPRGLLCPSLQGAGQHNPPQPPKH